MAANWGPPRASQPAQGRADRAALAVASTLHATGRLVEAERVLSRVLRVCPGDLAARRLMARITDAANAPLREHERHVDVSQETDPFNNRPPHSKQPTTNQCHPQSSGQRAPAADFPRSQPVGRPAAAEAGPPPQGAAGAPLQGGKGQPLLRSAGPTPPWGGPPPPRKARPAAAAPVTKADLDAELAWRSQSQTLILPATSTSTFWTLIS